MSKRLPELEFLAEDRVSNLSYREIILFAEIWAELIAFLRTRGKNPDRYEGFSESNIRPKARRIFQIYEYFWADGETVLNLSTDHGDEFINQLNKDEIVTQGGDPYVEGSKRKFAQALTSYFRFRGIEWNPPITFRSTNSPNGSDPFTIEERELLLKSALEYRSPPNYKNVSPDERDRWNAYLAQVLGKPKSEISPEDWDNQRTDWKIPSLISSTLDGGWRAELVGRLETGLIDLDAEEIRIPSHIAVKNDQNWVNQISSRTVLFLEKWLDQRSNISKYDNSDAVWLNRKGNPYDSTSLNNLLRHLCDDANIPTDSRKITWHSIRKSTGIYIYDKETDLELVADVLRHSSLESARQYAEATPETKSDVIESLQGDFQGVRS